MRTTTSLLLLFAATFPSPSHAADPPQKSEQNLTILRPTFPRGTHQLQGTFIRFRETDFDLLVIDNGPLRREARFHNLADAMTRNQCVAGTNGGFFDIPTFQPNGLMIANGQKTGTFDPKNWASGILAVRNSTWLLADQTHFTPDPSVTQLVQTGPWLVRDGTSQSGFKNDESPTRRTFIATDGAGTWLLGHIESSTLQELATLLTSPAAREILSIRDALNLDGGPSSALWCRRKETDPPVSIPEETIVRNYIGIRPKPASPPPTR